MDDQDVLKRAEGIQAATGHDSPVHYRSDDLYDRWHVATAVSRVIASSPLSWSTRIGLFGAWGDGKTSVLNLLEKQQAAANNIIIRFSPWGATSEREIWSGFTRSLSNGLKKARADVPRQARAAYYVRRHAPWLAKALGAAGKAANLKAPGASAATDFAAHLIEKYVAVSRKDAEAMSEIIGQRRVIVFIDDLDRTDPKVIPKLLLALRDLLDFSNFTFVLAFDRTIVVRALTAHNAAWQNAEVFLDKIIDFPFELPPPTRHQVERLARNQFAKLCPFVPSRALDSLAPMFPQNPRKLKLLGRVLASTRDEVSRHAQDEIKWDLVIIFAMLRLECSPLAGELLEMSVDIESSDAKWLHWALMKRDEREEATEQATLQLIEKHKQEYNEVRLRELIKAWRDAIPTLSGEGLRYQAMFTVTPQAITWGEFREFVRAWRPSKRPERALAFVDERARLSSQPKEDVAGELADAIIGYYATVLEKASSVKGGDAHLLLMREASDVLDLARDVFVEMTVPELAQIDLFSRWTRMHAVVSQWLHFTSNVEEPELRQKETSLLADFAERLGDPMDVYAYLKPWRDHDSVWGQRETELKTAFSDTLQRSVLPAAREGAFDVIRLPGALKRVRTPENEALQYLLGSPKSPLFAESKPALLDVLRERSVSNDVVDDATEYLSFLLSSLQHGDAFSTREEREAFIREHADVMALLWDQATSRPSQFRNLSTLRGYRSSMITAGLSEDALVAPPWLDEPNDRRA